MTVIANTPPAGRAEGLRWLSLDVVAADFDHTELSGVLRADPVILLPAVPDFELVRPWSVPFHITLPIARLMPVLGDCDVTLISSVAGYAAPPVRDPTRPITEKTPVPLPIPESAIRKWCVRALRMAAEPCPPSLSAPLCEALVKVERSEFWAVPLSFRAAELILQIGRPAVASARILRVGEVPGLVNTSVIGTITRQIRSGQLPSTDAVFAGAVSMADVVRTATASLPPGMYHLTDTSISARDVAEMLANALNEPVDLPAEGGTEPDAIGPKFDCARIQRVLPGWVGIKAALVQFGEEVARSEPPFFDPSLDVVIPPRPEEPARMARRHDQVYSSGQLKYGARWTRELTTRLVSLLGIDETRRVALTSSGTAALRLMVIATTGAAIRKNAVAVLPSFTFAATAEFLCQLGYQLMYCDVDEASWTMSGSALRRLLRSHSADLVVSVDALGNPADYIELNQICHEFGVPLVADSAPSIGAEYQGGPIGNQASAHAFSMSFAKVISSGGAGGFAVIPATADITAAGNWPRSSMMPEINAIIALDQLDHLDELMIRRRAVAAIYDEYADAVPSLVPQQVRPGNKHAYVHWVARIRPPFNRDQVAGILDRLGVRTKPYYAPPLHDELPGSMPDGLAVTRRLGAEVLALPISSEMTVSDAERVVSALHSALKRA